MTTETISNEQLADYYDAAADYIETHGWARGQLYSYKGQVCASGALYAVIAPDMFAQVLAREPVIMLPSYNTWIEAARRAIPNWSSITTWNDNCARDRFEVIDMFRMRAKELRDAH